MTPHLTRAQVREVDRRAIEQFRIPGIVLMENAARGVTAAATEMLEGNCCAEILIVCGGGNNGGDGLAVARHLHNEGADVSILLTVDPGGYKADALINWEIVKAMGLPASVAGNVAEEIGRSSAVLIVDAIFGTGLSQAPREPFGQIVRAMHQTHIPVLAIDLPSGLDCDTGQPLGPCVQATRTVTFVAEKAGFANPASRQYTGAVTVAGIGCPKELVEQVVREMDGTAKP